MRAYLLVVGWRAHDVTGNCKSRPVMIKDALTVHYIPLCSCSVIVTVCKCLSLLVVFHPGQTPKCHSSPDGRILTHMKDANTKTECHSVPVQFHRLPWPAFHTRQDNEAEHPPIEPCGIVVMSLFADYFSFIGWHALLVSTSCSIQAGATKN